MIRRNCVLQNGGANVGMYPRPKLATNRSNVNDSGKGSKLTHYLRKGVI